MTIFIPSASTQQTLSSYLIAVRRLLHDANGKYWSDSELTDYINQSRFRVVSDTGCNRFIQSVSTVQGQESYPFATSGLPQGINTIDVLNVTILWGGLRVPCSYMPFTQFNLEMRAWQTFQNRPTCFTVYGQNTIMLGPIPDQVYAMEWDSIAMPTLLAVATDGDSLVFPYTEPVPFYAAYLAKFKEQSYDDSDRFLKTYTMKVGAALRSASTRRITIPFAV